MQHQSTDLTILRNLNILYRCHKWQKWQTMRKMALRKISWNIQTIMFKNSISYYSCVQQGVFTYLENTYKKWKFQSTKTNCTWNHYKLTVIERIECIELSLEPKLPIRKESNIFQRKQLRGQEKKSRKWQKNVVSKDTSWFL